MSSKAQLLQRLGGLLTYRELRELVLSLEEHDRRQKVLKVARYKPLVPQAITLGFKMTSENYEYQWSPQAEVAWGEITRRRNCKVCNVEDPPIMSLDGTCERCLHKQGRAACCLEGACGVCSQ